MLDPASWLAQAQALPPGRKRRVDHDCGAGRTLLVENKAEGYSAWCHRCNDKGWFPHPQPSLAERIERARQRQQVEQEVRATATLPMPAEYDPQAWPMWARLWLYKVGFSNDDITRLGWYYNQRLDRVVLPVVSEDAVVYWQARGHDPAAAKYLNPLVPKEKLTAKYGSGPVLVLTEDILSAARVGRVTEAWSLLGTKLHDGVAAEIARLGKPVVLMLDPDEAGRRGNAKAQRLLRSMAVDTHIVVPRRDPKYLTKEELLCVLPFLTP